MRTKTIILALTLFLAGIFSGSFTSEKNSSKGKFVNVQAAVRKGDWATYKKEQDEKISKNEKRISELRAAKANTDEAVNNLYNKQIDKIEKKIPTFKSRSQLTNSMNRSGSLAVVWMNLVQR